MASFGTAPSASRLWLRGDDVSALFATISHGRNAPPAVESSRVALADYFRITRAYAVASHEESLGFAPRPLVAGTTNFVVARAADRIGLADAMKQVAEAYNTLHGGEYNTVRPEPNGFAFIIDDRAFPYPQQAAPCSTFMMECVLINLHGLACTLAGEDLTAGVVRIETRRQQPVEDGPTGFWTCPVVFGAPAFALVYSNALADHPIKGVRLHEEAVHSRVLALIEKREQGGDTIAMQVRQCIREGVDDQGEAARRLGCSTATLRRRLAHEGLSFRSLRREILNEAAQNRLLTRPRIADVADALGFSDSRSFARAFKSWNGATPRSFRGRTSGH